MSGSRAIEVERCPTPNLTHGRAGHRPRGIIVHTTAGSYESAVSWFSRRESGVSSHYLVALDGRVAQFVEEEDTARHAGRVLDPTTELISGDDPNLSTIGIEFEDAGDPEGVERTEEQYEVGALLIAAVAQRWDIPLDRKHVIGHREVFAAKACPGNLDLERLLRGARERSNRVVCLLPARNAARDIPGYIESVACFADAVVALDDGSTDETAELLQDSPLVEVLLSNSRREGYAGWDDGRNRERLLDAAAGLEPRWVIFLDSDERLDPADARALRGFLESDAIPGCTYGLELHRMWGDRLSVGPFSWVYRLFAFTPELSLPARPLHFNPVPVQVPRRAWVRTTIRVRHLDSPERLAERRAKYEQADPDRAHEQRPARLLGEPAEGELRPWTARDAGTPVLDPGAVARRLSAEPPPAPSQGRPRLVCLLPVRNGEQDIPGYLESVGSFADAVIALDDGSSDRTAELLEESKLVEGLLRNPPRPDYKGWDDAANRSRLLAEAVRTGAAWALWLDADERIDPGDGVALRRFVDRDADPGSAYGFRVFRMVGDGDHYDRAELWVYRLFAPRPGQELSDRRLHLVPVPFSIPRSSWKRTTVRIQHLAGLNLPRRLARVAKYEQADPERRFQRDYFQLLKSGGEPRAWKRRPAGLPVLADPLERGARAELDLERLDLDAPILSAIVISRNDEDRIECAVRSVVEQECPQEFEVIVVVSGEDRTAEIVRERFPDVQLIELEGPALPGRARNAGVAAARGEYLSFPGSHVELPPGSLAARIEGHELGYPMVTGSIINGTPTLSGWASYFLDHAGALPGRPSAELEAPPAHCSYSREFVLEIGGFPEHLRAGEDTVVNRALFSKGHVAYRAQDVRLIHRSRCSRPWRLLRHHFRRGRSWGRIVLDDHRGGQRLLRWPMVSYLFARYVPSRLTRTWRQVRRWGGKGLRRRYRRSLPLVALATLAAWIGIWVEIALPGRGKLGVLFVDQRRPPGVGGLASEDAAP
ncbi:MAG: glycosyltransferase [Solirubrobacterales bacterium]